MCEKHGVYKTKVTSIKQGKKCYKCSREIALKKKAGTTLADRRHSLYEKAVFIANQNGYKLLSDEDEIYRNTSIIQYECPEHGVKSMRISNFINGRHCPDCALDSLNKTFKLSEDEVIARIEQYGGTITNPSEYINRSTRNLNILCPTCGRTFKTSLVLFTQHGGQVCNSCKSRESNGERLIRKYLEGNNIRYESQKWFNDCRDVYPLPFDFYLEDYNMIIEFDGKQHFEDRNGFAYPLEKTQMHDSIKTKYCNDNGIFLLRIPYWEINKIEKIIDEHIYLHEDIV